MLTTSLILSKSQCYFESILLCYVWALLFVDKTNHRNSKPYQRNFQTPAMDRLRRNREELLRKRMQGSNNLLSSFWDCNYTLLQSVKWPTLFSQTSFQLSQRLFLRNTPFCRLILKVRTAGLYWHSAGFCWRTLYIRFTSKLLLGWLLILSWFL